MEPYDVNTYEIQREIRGRWETIYKVVNSGYIFTNTDTKPRRVINIDKNLVAVLPSGRHYGKDLVWKKR